MHTNLEMLVPGNRFSRNLIASLLAFATLFPHGARAQALPEPEPIPPVPAPRPVGSVPLGDPRTFPEVKLTFPIAEGPFGPTWDSIEKNYPAKELAWLRDAKFGIWIHFGPQAAGQSGDWYARRMYIEGSPAYNNHLRNFGHPSEVGYKELLRDWNPMRADPGACLPLSLLALEGENGKLGMSPFHGARFLWRGGSACPALRGDAGQPASLPNHQRIAKDKQQTI